MLDFSSGDYVKPRKFHCISDVISAPREKVKIRIIAPEKERWAVAGYHQNKSSAAFAHTGHLTQLLNGILAMFKCMIAYNCVSRTLRSGGFPRLTRASVRLRKRRRNIAGGRHGRRAREGPTAGPAGPEGSGEVVAYNYIKSRFSKISK